jgi:aspartyl-tRNA(Asn)/glutamyl-tRNA(Gln) amidotransferase subunit A
MSTLPARLPTLADASAAIAAGKISPVMLTEAAIARAEALQPTLSAFITLAVDRAREAARCC